jgi:hypothetical protein
MSDISMTKRIMQIHLSSWRYFAVLSLPPLVLAYNLIFSIDSLLLMGFFLLTHYYCWRLWLDERLFQLIESECDLVEFDSGMSYLWAKKKRTTRTMVERLNGTRILFYRAILSLVVLWFVSMCTVLYQFLG